MQIRRAKTSRKPVALLAEGVDRNMYSTRLRTEFALSPSSRRAWIEIRLQLCKQHRHMSPSSRRAWIEISSAMSAVAALSVALLAEGVDRNSKVFSFSV